MKPLLYIYTSPLNHEPLARIDGPSGQEEIRYFHHNLAGLPELLTDEQGMTLWHSDYCGWGKSREEWQDQSQKDEQNLRYPGQYHDRETGFHYNIFRFYDPDIGRFAQLDPIGLNGGINLYCYAPNTFTFIDPLGLNRTPIVFLPDGGDILHPGTTDPLKNPEGIYRIQATGSYYDDKLALYKAAGLKEPPSSKWISHHVEYHPSTNEMSMQLVNPKYHAHPHIGGAHEFESITGYKYGSPQAVTEASRRNKNPLYAKVKTNGQEKAICP